MEKISVQHLRLHPPPSPTRPSAPIPCLATRLAPRGTAPSASLAEPPLCHLPASRRRHPPPPRSVPASLRRNRPRLPVPPPSRAPRAAAVPGSPRRSLCPCLCSTLATTGPTPLGVVEPIFNLCGGATLRLRFVLFSTAGEHPGLEAPFLLGTAPAAVATSASLKIRLLWCAAACLVTQLRGPVGYNIAQLAAHEKPNCWALLLGSRGRRSRFYGRETGWFSEGS
jgi:hypothetical protein